MESGESFPSRTSNLQNLPLDSDLYRKLTKISYSEHIPVPKLINDMLREHIDVYLQWRKVGYILVSKEAARKALMYVPNEELIATAESIATRIREAAIILNGRPSPEGYIRLMKSFAAVNGFHIEKSKGADGNTEVLIVQFRMSEKYSKFLGNTYRLLVEEFAEIVNFETTDNLAFIEYKLKAGVEKA